MTSATTVKLLPLFIVMAGCALFNAQGELSTETFETFSDWCDNKRSLSQETRHTINVLLERAETQTCDRAEENLNNLTALDISRSQITDLSPLTSLTNLSEVNLGGNQLTDLSPLAGLSNLTRLDLYMNQVADVSPLADLNNLTALEIHFNQIEDLTPLAGLVELKQLDLSNNRNYSGHAKKTVEVRPTSDPANMSKISFSIRLINLPSIGNL